MKCYKCWHLEHISAQCKSNIDRYKLCIKCGEEGHKIGQCKNDAACTLCTEANKVNRNHIVGSGKCAVVMEETQTQTKPRR